MTKIIGRVTIFAIFIFALGAGVFLTALWSVDDALTYEPSLKVGIIDVQGVGAKSFLVSDMETGAEIVSKASTEVLPIASITKLFTAASFRTTNDLDATTTITWSDVMTEGRAGKLKAYDVYQNRELLYPLLLESSNDAAATLLRIDPELIVKMYAYATSAQLFKTQFSDTSGLSDKNVSTASELFLMAQKLYFDQPYIFDITRLKQYIGTNTGWVNNNPFVATEGYRGGKNGFTHEANRTGIFLFEETVATNQKRIFSYVILGSNDVVSDVQALREVVQKNVRFE